MLCKVYTDLILILFFLEAQTVISLGFYMELLLFLEGFEGHFLAE